MTIKKQQSVTLCGETITGSPHICAFFDSREEQYEILLPWLKEGIDNNEEVLTILESNKHHEHRLRLLEANIPVEETVQRGQLKVVASEDTYLREGAFAAERMFNIVEQALIGASSGPYRRFRGCGEMEWALKNMPGTDELMEYEARLNHLSKKHECSILCIYDINRFSGSAVADVLATHSHVIMHGKIHINPHFMEPLDYLQKLIQRPKRPLGNRANIS